MHYSAARRQCNQSSTNVLKLHPSPAPLEPRLCVLSNPKVKDTCKIQAEPSVFERSIALPDPIMTKSVIVTNSAAHDENEMHVCVKRNVGCCPSRKRKQEMQWTERSGRIDGAPINRKEERVVQEHGQINCEVCHR